MYLSKISNGWGERLAPLTANKRGNVLNRRDVKDYLEGLNEAEQQEFLEGMKASVKYLTAMYEAARNKATKVGVSKSVRNHFYREAPGLGTAIHDLANLHMVSAYAVKKMNESP